MPVSTEDLFGGVNDSEASALFYWLCAVPPEQAKTLLRPRCSLFLLRGRLNSP